ncbi:helix-turn-helix transcriptional regulator [Vibrio renipiscarius]|uniref:helix-turn-helix transcriptional regulator n=1 Tax=Vibrio renipiscarius TaxID=1461322 RepID=UPI000699F6F9|nr:response regulator transcription factor [Vibrio renipiscarius]
MDNNQKKIVLVCESNIQFGLIKEVLESVKSIKLSLWYYKELGQEIADKELDIALIDYNYINSENLEQLYSNLPSGCGIVFFNVREKMPKNQLIRWPNLKGVLYNTAPVSHLAKCLDHVACGDMWLPRKLMVAMLKQSHESTQTERNVELLTRRERQILNLLVTGQSNQKIADNLYITESTVKTHIYRLYKKMNVRCRKEAMSCVNLQSNRFYYDGALS